MLTYLAQVLASDENPQVRDGNHALAMAAKANDLTGGVQPAMIDAMAMAYAELGQFTNAQQTAAYALKLATAYDMTNDVPLIQQRLQLYQNRQPFRQSFHQRADEGTAEKLNHAAASARSVRRTCGFFKTSPAENFSPSHGSAKIRLASKNSREQLCVCGTRGVPLRRRHQNDARPGRGAARQRFQREQNVVDRAEPVRRDDHRRRAQRRNQIARIEILAERA